MVRLEPMTQADYQQFIKWAIEDYAQGQVLAGSWQQKDSMQRGRGAFDELLPDGLSTPDQFLYVIQDEAHTPVGYMWFGVRDDAGPKFIALYDLLIFEEHRRRGYGSQALAVLENKVRDLGMKQIVLHVFGHNAGARALYRKSGYRERDVTMVKETG